MPVGASACQQRPPRLRLPAVKQLVAPGVTKILSQPAFLVAGRGVRPFSSGYDAIGIYSKGDGTLWFELVFTLADGQQWYYTYGDGTFETAVLLFTQCHYPDPDNVANLLGGRYFNRFTRGSPVSKGLSPPP